MKIPFISNLKKPACASKRDMLELATLRYIEVYAYLLQPIQLLLIFVWFTAKKHFNIISTFFYSRITQRTKMINGKSKWMDIGLNRIRSTTKIRVIGNCCWEIKAWIFLWVLCNVISSMTEIMITENRLLPKNLFLLNFAKRRIFMARKE